MSIFIQIIILLAILASMVMVLLAIRQLSHFEGFENEQDTAFLKEEIDDREEIISNHNMFHQLLEKGKKEMKEGKIYNKTSNDPFKRKE